MLRNIFTAIALLLSGVGYAQELNCKVQVNAQKIAGLDQNVFKRLEQSINEFMNNQAFTQDVFTPQERIECGLTILFESNPSQDVFSATIIASSSRPVFNSTYNSPLINLQDRDFDFTYTENTPIIFNINQFTSNLSSVLAYYAYLFIALDYESMGKGNGAKYFQALETILNQVPPGLNGWNRDGGAVGGNRNRFNMINSFQNPRFDPFKEAYTNIHLNALDIMYDKPDKARQTIIASLESLVKAFRDFPNNVLITVFMQTKREEFINIFSASTQGEKVKVVGLLKQLDPPNAPMYDRIIKGN
jgi:hypothetical protein